MKNNTRSRVLRAIQSNGDKEWTAREVAERIGQKPDNVSYHLRSLAKDGEIAKTGAGRYSKSRTDGRNDLLGLSRRQYASQYGWSVDTARAILASEPRAARNAKESA